MQRLAWFLLLALLGCSSPEPAPPISEDTPAEGLPVSQRIHPAWNAVLGKLFEGGVKPTIRPWTVAPEGRLLTRSELRAPRTEPNDAGPGRWLGRPEPRSQPIPNWPLVPLQPWGEPSPPSGNVVALRLDLEPAWVLLDVGSTHHVKAGHIFEVRRHGVPLARLVLDEVIVGQSAGRILHAADARRVQLGDEVHYVGIERRTEERLDWNGWPELPVPSIDAEVLATRGGVVPRLVLLDVGEEDRVEPGFQFSVYRKDRFVAKVVVERVLRDSAGCRVLFSAEGLHVQPGDKAATRLQ